MRGDFYMDSYRIKVNYLYNSGFAVETDNYLMIFDYYKDSVDQGEKDISNGAISENNLGIGKTIIVFSTHSHGDHFNPIILEWCKKRSDIIYVLSSDIELDKKNENINIIAPYENLRIDNINIKAYGSTDIGISILVEVGGNTIFHAGDLNWWYWWDDTKEEIERMETAFKSEIAKINSSNIDIAFFPVDQRLRHNYCLGAKYFIEEAKPKLLIPMHFGDVFETTSRFKDEMKNSSTKVAEITHRGQEIIYEGKK
jgi:L-ascorbate metabolism protein UlaG (beta-lactamase superfamily)